MALSVVVDDADITCSPQSVYGASLPAAVRMPVLRATAMITASDRRNALLAVLNTELTVAWQDCPRHMRHNTGDTPYAAELTPGTRRAAECVPLRPGPRARGPRSAPARPPGGTPASAPTGEAHCESHCPAASGVRGLGVLSDGQWS